MTWRAISNTRLALPTGVDPSDALQDEMESRGIGTDALDHLLIASGGNQRSAASNSACGAPAGETGTLCGAAMAGGVIEKTHSTDVVVFRPTKL